MTSVLLAGDVSNRDALADSFVDAGLSVVRAGDAVAAVERLEATAIDCLLLHDPDPDRFVRHLQRRGHDVPVLLDGDGGDGMTFEADGVVDTAAPEQVISSVEDAVADAHIARERAARRRRDAAVADARRTVHEGVDGDPLQALCDRLADGDSYTAAWLGRHDASSGAVVPRAVAGVPELHLGAVPVGGEVRNATAQAIRRENVVVDTEGDHAFLVVPVGEGPLAVLHLYADRPDGVPDRERETLAELGAAICERLRASGETDAKPDGLSVLGDTLAHELGNQLDLASVHLDLAREQDDESHFGYVESALDRMADLAEEARALARDDLSPTEVPVHEAAAERWESVDPADATLHTTEVVVEADPDLLELLLGNLLRNSLDHAGDDVTVTVGPHEEGFYVADDGPGIPEAEREEVFEWGYSTGGSGAGLGIVSLVAERHGWSVEVTESDAGGARFEFV